MIITRIRGPSGTNAQTEVRDHGFPKEAGMAGLSISPNHRPRILPGCSTRGTDPGTATGGEDSTFSRLSRLGVSASPRSY
jgi:hypothetical protein